MPNRTRFTQAFLDSLPTPPKGKRVMYHDALQGFAVRVTDTGAKTFCAYGRVRNGPPRIVRIGPYPGMKIHDARELAKNTVAAMMTGADPNADKKQARANAERSSTTLQQLLYAYIDTKRLKPNTIRDYKETVNANYKAWLDLPFESVTPEMVKAQFVARSRVSPSRANNGFRVLRALYNFARIEYKYAGGNPVAILGEMKLWNRNKRKQTFITQRDLEKWFAAVLDCPNETARDLFLFIILTGCRPEEGAASLKWSNVDLTDKSYKIHDSKSGDDLTLPLCSYLVAVLKARQKKAVNDYVFPSPVGGHIKRVETWVNWVEKKSGVEFTLYDLRRTFATAAESLDMSPYTLKRLMGHRVSDKDVTGGYVVPNVDRLRSASKLVTDLILKGVF